jgi:D-alanyl-D-alanine carboxypeptidase
MDSALAASLQALLDKHVRQGLPGAALAVRGPFGSWVGTSGYASLEHEVRLEPCHLHFLASVTKPILAATVLKEVERGNLGLDDGICGYLPPGICGQLYDSENQTIRKLLGHRSRIPAYSDSWRYRSDWLMDPLRDFDSYDLLKYVEGQKAGEEKRQGNGYYYSDTNYLLLGLILDFLANGDHARLLRERIFEPLGMEHTAYARDALVRFPGSVVNSYFDRFGNGKLENISDIQRHDETRAIGSHGLVSTAGDLALFMEGLFQGRLLDSASLQAMTDGALYAPDLDSLEGEDLYYGLGMGYAYSREKGLVLEHDGANPGTQSLVRYGREGRVTMAFVSNLGLYADNSFFALGDEVMELLRTAVAVNTPRK